MEKEGGQEFRSLEVREASSSHLKSFFPWLLNMVKYQEIPILADENLVVPDKISQKNFMKTPILHNYIFIFT